MGEPKDRALHVSLAIQSRSNEMPSVLSRMKIKVKTSPQEEAFEIDVDPTDTVENLIQRLRNSSSYAAVLGDCCELELCPLLASTSTASEIIRELVSMINQGSAQLAELTRSWHNASCTVSDPNFGSVEGLEASMLHYSSIAAALGDVQLSVDRMVESGPNSVKVWWTLSAALVGPILGIDFPSGKRFETSGSSTHITRNGRLESSEWNWNAVGFMMQVGAFNCASPCTTDRTAEQQLRGNSSREPESDSEYSENSPTSSGSENTQTPSSLNSEDRLDEPANWCIKSEACVDFDVSELLDNDSFEFQLRGASHAAIASWKSEPQFSVADHSSCMPVIVQSQEMVALNSEMKGVKRELPSHGDVVCLRYLEYECGYCAVRRVSTSIGGDGRVRIRCDCGGKHQDRKPRMHAKWKLCTEMAPTTQDQPLAITHEPDHYDSSFTSCKRAKVAEFQSLCTI